MSSSLEYLTTQEFAKKTGVSASTVSKWLRGEKISGKKENGKWIIPRSEISKITSPRKAPEKIKATAKSTPAVKATNTKTGSNHYSIEEFSAMTYLTEFGVKKWLKEGRLIAATDNTGKPMVASSNLESPFIKRLIR